jgi:hypothetical protein
MWDSHGECLTKITVFSDVLLYSLVENYFCFGRGKKRLRLLKLWICSQYVHSKRRHTFTKVFKLKIRPQTSFEHIKWSSYFLPSFQKNERIRLGHVLIMLNGFQGLSSRRQKNRGSIPARKERIFFSPRRPDRLWDFVPRLSQIPFPGIKQIGRRTDFRMVELHLYAHTFS